MHIDVLWQLVRVRSYKLWTLKCLLDRRQSSSIYQLLALIFAEHRTEC